MIYNKLMEIKEIEEEIKGIKFRNKRVEAEKAWETSLFRISLIAVITYIAASIIFYLTGRLFFKCFNSGNRLFSFHSIFAFH